ncbi:MAG TPA: amidohydrolase family protein [Candidatus Cloacimonadota bacterium]|nr:amidohydrolase family protein [Candidatus Cloacimonadota bacterium]
MMCADLIIRGGSIISMDSTYSIHEDSLMVVDKGRIIAIRPATDEQYTADKTIDARDCLIIPGLINTHTHLPMTYFRGLADDMVLQDWLQGYIWPLEAKLVKPQFVYDATLHGASEMIKNGITLANDMYFHMGSIAEACTRAGFRVIISEALLDHAMSEEDRKTCIGNRLKALMVKYRDNNLISFSLAPHSIYTCTPATLRRCGEVAQENDWLVHMHLSETRQEVENCLKEHGKRPVEYLQDLGFLGSRCLFAHGIWLDDAELELLANSRSAISICTDSHLKLNSGFAPIKKMHEHGVTYSLGTDGVASNNNLDLLSELDYTAKLHKLLAQDTTFLPAREALAMVTRNAARALGMQDRLGSLEVGKDADITILNTHDLECQPLYNPYSQIVYAMSSRQVRDVVIAGEVVLDRGKLIKVDESELIETAKHYRHDILSGINQ